MRKCFDTQKDCVQVFKIRWILIKVTLEHGCLQCGLLSNWPIRLRNFSQPCSEVYLINVRNNIASVASVVNPGDALIYNLETGDFRNKQ